MDDEGERHIPSEDAALGIDVYMEPHGIRGERARRDLRAACRPEDAHAGEVAPIGVISRLSLAEAAARECGNPTISCLHEHPVQKPRRRTAGRASVPAGRCNDDRRRENHDR